MSNATIAAILNGTVTDYVPTDEVPTWYHYAGISFALTSGLFIGTSFIFKKKGLLQTVSAHGELGHGHKYLDNPLWWTGMVLMALGEALNFVAYAFSPAILVAPLGAISVVVSAILSEIYLNEKLNLTGKIGCIQCVIGSVLIVIHAPESNSSETIPEFFGYASAPLFIFYFIVCSGAIGYLVYYIAPTHGDKNPIVYILICSLVGSFLVISCQGFGSALVYTFSHWTEDNQFLQWQIYPLMGFIGAAVCGQIHFLNKALNQFSTAVVTPVYYVTFTTCTLCTSAVLFRGFTVDSTTAGVSLVMGFLVIAGGVSLLFEFNERLARHKVWRERRAAGAGGAGARILGSLESFFSQSGADTDVAADAAGGGAGACGSAAGKDTHTRRGVAVLRSSSLAGTVRAVTEPADTDERTPIMEQP